MAITESSFGARLRNAQDLVAFLAGFENYNPPREQEKVTELTALLNQVVAANSTTAKKKEDYRTGVDARQIAFRESELSLMRIPAMLAGAVEAQYGKSAPQAKDLATIVRKIRGVKLTKAPTNPDSETQQKTVSVSQQSYGSLTQLFNDMVSTVGQFEGYTSSNPLLTVAGLQTKAAELTTLNDAVAASVQALSAARHARNTKYEQLKDSISRVKSYVKSQYGSSSQQYNMIKGIKV